MSTPHPIVASLRNMFLASTFMVTTINIKAPFLAITALFSTGCTQVGVQLANLPTYMDSNEQHLNIAYGEHPQHHLDIYLPAQTTSEQQPVVVFFYGGRWTDGDKSMYPFVAKPFVDRGYIVVVPDYRKYPEVIFPAFVEDAALAVAWTLENIADYQGNPDKLVLMGHSAGAHIGALISADERYLASHGHSSRPIKAFAGLSGPYDFIPKDEDLKDIFGPPERYPEMTVTRFIDGTEPPMLLLWGAQDTLVGRRNLDLLQAEVAKQGGQAETKIYPNMGHVDMVANLIWFMPSKASIAQDVSEFFTRQLQGEHYDKLSP
ncbi:Carboxylesterase NlhH [Marinomonas aquimarina]|uniref:Carboxylesterase NlhH n=1 Tax=Marinomonas aquimarina TaxID=295068 RepID=A0A1A8T9Q7_9GAMM|nr:alpha/beta hydrolase [Marinomonas aquimarina]SBS28151.1 Carboxylesterase NlhH [Marinomonas aquimarina]